MVKLVESHEIKGHQLFLPSQLGSWWVMSGFKGSTEASDDSLALCMF